MSSVTCHTWLVPTPKKKYIYLSSCYFSITLFDQKSPFHRVLSPNHGIFQRHTHPRTSGLMDWIGQGFYSVQMPISCQTNKGYWNKSHLAMLDYNNIYVLLQITFTSKLNASLKGYFSGFFLHNRYGTSEIPNWGNLEGADWVKNP